MRGMIGMDFCIFYADDDMDDRNILKDVSSEISSSLQVITFGSGDELLYRLRNPPPKAHLVLLDLNMPKKNGYDILREIKASTSLLHLPVIIFSTSDDPKAIRKTRDLGASLYIPKPSSYKLFKDAIEYCVTNDWLTFSTSDENFVYGKNQPAL